MGEMGEEKCFLSNSGMQATPGHEGETFELAKVLVNRLKKIMEDAMVKYIRYKWHVKAV